MRVEGDLVDRTELAFSTSGNAPAIVVKGAKRMNQDALLECSFFIPIRRDSKLSDGNLHSKKAWAWLKRELYLRFEGGSISLGHYEGFYKDPDTLEQVADRSRKYVVAIPRASIGDLRSLLSAACTVFRQKCIYLSVTGKVEFIHADEAQSWTPQEE